MSGPSKAERQAAWDAMTPRQRMAFQREKDLKALESPNYNSQLVERAKERMSRVDALTADMREVVHEFGLELVHEFMSHGVLRSHSIRYLIQAVRNDPIKGGQNRFRYNTAPTKGARASSISRNVAGGPDPIEGRKS